MNDTEEIDKISIVGSGLMRLAEEQIGIRQTIEDRWLRDLEQYLGQYDEQTNSRLQKSGKSRAFVNGTRAKTAAAQSRLSDMLFPTDDRNWGILPTPVPELDGIKKSNDVVMDENGQSLQDEEGRELTGVEYSEIVMEEAREKAEAMEREIEDHLTEANYQDTCREVIDDACLYGTGVIKAPVIVNRTRKKWEQVDGDVHSLATVDEYRPGVERVKIWDFFPDMSATDIKDAQFVFERRFVSKKQLIDLSKRPGYLPEQISIALRETPVDSNATGSSYIAKLRELSNLNVDINKGKYELWEYHGALDNDDLITCGCDIDEDNELEEREVIVAFIGSHIIKVDLNPMETGERPYSMFIYEKDDSSIFGMGVPFIVRNEQRIMNSAWRMVLDNAGISTGPQTIINKDIITPSDGEWTLKPNKIWWADGPETDTRRAFTTYDIPSHQGELTAIYDKSKQMMDEVTNLPLLAQGEIGGAPDTASGMSMLLNSSNVVLRRVVKSFDDNITVPVITRFYDWLMQNSDKEEIKGDFNINARGSSTLLVKETQQQALMSLMSIANSPTFAPLTKHAELYRKAVQAQHLVADDIVKTDDEIEQENNEQQPPPVDLQIAEIEGQLKMAIEQLKSDTDIEVARIRSNDNQVKVATDAQRTQLQEDVKANMFMAEAQLKEKYGEGI